MFCGPRAEVVLRPIFCYLTLKSVYWTINKNSHWYIITYTHKPVNLLLAPLFNPPPLIRWSKRNLSWIMIMIHSADRSYWPITSLTLHVDWSGMFYSPDFRTGSWNLSNRAACDDFQLQMLDIFHLAFPLVIHGELNQTIPLTTPSSSYLKRQYLKPQIKQAHLSTPPPPHHPIKNVWNK